MSRFYIFVEFFGIRQFPKFCPIIHWSSRAIILFNNYFIKLLKNSLENQLRLSTVVVAYFHSVWKSQKKFHYILNIATEAISLKCQNWSIWQAFEILKLRPNSVTRQVNYNRKKIGWKCQEKFKCDFFCDFQTLWNRIKISAFFNHNKANFKSIQIDKTSKKVLKLKAVFTVVENP